MPIESDLHVWSRPAFWTHYAKPLLRGRACARAHAQLNAIGPSYPLITIGIPTRNRASLVKDCVESALAQSYQNIEVLVSDNASTDDTLASSAIHQ